MDVILKNVTDVQPTRIWAPPLLETQPLMAWIYIGVTGFLILWGVFGNISLFITLAMNKEMQKVGREFMYNMCCTDLFVTMVNDPLCLLAVFKGEQWFQERPIVCLLVASFCFTACICAVVSLTMMNLARMCYICYNNVYHKFFGKYKCILLCLVCWLSAMLIESFNFVGWGGHFYDDQNTSCIWDRTKRSFALFVATMIFMPLLLMIFCNAKIFFEIKNTKTNLQKVQDETKKSAVWKETIKASKTLFWVVGVFTLCWMPYSIMVFIDAIDHDFILMPIHLFVTLLAHAHSTINFSVFLYTNKKFRKLFMKTLRKVYCCCFTFKEVDSGLSTTSQSHGTVVSTVQTKTVA